MTKYFVILILFCCIRSEAQTWDLVWSDEFDSDSINKANWNIETVYYNGGGGELEYYLPRNVSVSGGFLAITAKKENYGGAAYTSGRMNTYGLQNFTYGRIEARIKIPMGQGLWPAFWMLGSNISQVSWPKCGEIDILEHINNATYIVGTMHWDNNGHVQAGAATTFTNVSQYHVYSIEWDADSIKWFLDGKKYYGGNIKNNINSTEELHMPFYILLNLAVGGNWPGNPDATTSFPDTMFVDYVRVYRLATGIVSDGSEHIPDHFTLSQNYPNPFNPSTTISFHLPSKSFVSLIVFDVIGREVASIVLEEMQSGNYSRQWNASDFPSGIYFYRLQAGAFTETKKLILLK